MRFPISLKISLAFVALSVVLIGVFAFWSYRKTSAELEDKFGLTLKHIVATAALGIHGGMHDRIVSANDSKSFAFTTIRDYLVPIMKANSLSPDTFYSFHLNSDESVSFAVMLHDQPFVGSPYSIPKENRQYFVKAMHGESVQTPMYHDAHGVWISGLAPIRNLDGKVVGILEADYRVEKFLAALHSELIRILGIGLGILLLGVLITLLFSRTITRPIYLLKGMAIEMASGKYDFDLHISSRDEVEDLYHSFKTMARAVGERLVMLKYIPAHTLEMIGKSIQTGEKNIPENRKVVILFSDIRGFTAFSELRSPEEVIGRLNHLLGIQARIISSHHGEVDKFVGDEVVALFEGQNAIWNAVVTSIEIQNEIKKSDLSVGIGISFGEVVFGNIGSDERKEYSVIGSNVNLAARLCSYAKESEICVSSAVQKELSVNPEWMNRLAIAPRGTVDLKGFSQAIHVFSISDSKKT